MFLAWDQDVKSTMSQWVVLTTIIAELNYQIKKRQICEFKYSKFSQGCKTSYILFVEGFEPIPWSCGTNFNDAFQEENQETQHCEKPLL